MAKLDLLLRAILNKPIAEGGMMQVVGMGPLTQINIGVPIQPHIMHHKPRW